MLRSLTLPPLLLVMMMMMSLTIDARSVKIKISTTEEPVEDTTYMRLPDGTITVDIDSDLILTTSPEGETFSEASPLELTEEPLPDSVIQQLERERAQEERARNPIDTESETEAETEETTTERRRTTKKSHRFGAGTSMPMGFSSFPTMKPEYITTENTQGTTQYQEMATPKNYFKRWPANVDKGGDMEMAENRMETTTMDALTFQDEKQDYVTTPVMIMTTEGNLLGERVTYPTKAETVTTQSPLFRFFTTTSAKPLVTETQPETTTMWPETKEEATTMPVLMESTETITERAETTTATTATEPEPLTARMELYLNAALESTSTTTTSSTSAPEATTVPETTTLSIGIPETTTSTTSAPETTTTTQSAPETTTTTQSALETTTSTSSAPETATSTTSALETTTSTTSAPETTTSTSSAPETTTSTTNAPETTRAPETTTSTTSAPETSRTPETTTSTTRAPETTTSTTSAPETSRTPETTTSTTSAPEPTISTTSAPEVSTTSTTTTPLTTIPSTRAPETTTTTTTTTPRPILTRAPRVERIFNSDGVEVLYGYSSVVRTNRS
ncbi:mucin-5AC [Drosophila serrata]|uniref:mucin-5AC n=1 Tax=Drosophila serrata TaxID=7274 RepID=UPI000A1D3935|nr:mucin-5AC [Drosophila serrata]